MLKQENQRQEARGVVGWLVDLNEVLDFYLLTQMRSATELKSFDQINANAGWHLCLNTILSF